MFFFFIVAFPVKFKPFKQFSIPLGYGQYGHLFHLKETF